MCPCGQLALGAAPAPQQKLCSHEIMTSLKYCPLLIIWTGCYFQEIRYSTWMDSLSGKETRLPSQQGGARCLPCQPGGISFLYARGILHFNKVSLVTDRDVLVQMSDTGWYVCAHMRDHICSSCPGLHSPWQGYSSLRNYHDSD